MFIVFLLSTIQALSTGLDGGKELCLGIQGKKTALFQISFVVSGFQEDNIEMKFYSPRKTLLKSSIKQKEGNYKEIMTDDGQYEVCFKSLDKYYKLISFNFDFIEENDLALAVNENKVQKGNQIIKRLSVYGLETMDQMAEDMKQAYRSLKTIQNNQHYQNDRENEHQRMLESTEKKLWWCSAGKMGALIVICISQIYMLTGYGIHQEINYTSKGNNLAQMFEIFIQINIFMDQKQDHTNTILAQLESTESLNSMDVAKSLAINHQDLVGYLLQLESANYIKTEGLKQDQLILTEEGNMNTLMILSIQYQILNLENMKSIRRYYLLKEKISFQDFVIFQSFTYFVQENIIARFVNSSTNVKLQFIISKKNYHLILQLKFSLNSYVKKKMKLIHQKQNCLFQKI